MDEKGFVEGVRRYMSQLREEKRYSSAKSYQDALNSFIKYSGTENISYSDIKTTPGELGVEDKIVTLSTCTGNESTRYVVQGKRVDTLDVGKKTDSSEN